MNKQERVALAIKEVVSKMMDRVMEEKNGTNKSLYSDRITGNVGLGRLKRIQEVLSRSYHKNYEFDWEEDVRYILAAKGQLLPVTINCNIFTFIERVEGNFTFEFNDSISDIHKMRDIKEDILKFIVMSVQ
ncbi:MAG: hypothetical protein U5N85_16365 [Arcicella sp.]|nr:hypothetical protein [Arcicella sp.]